MATAAEQNRAANGEAQRIGARALLPAMPAHMRRLLAAAVFLLLFAGFSLVPALQGLSLSAGQNGGAPDSVARAADSVAAAQAEALATRP